MNYSQNFFEHIFIDSEGVFFLRALIFVLFVLCIWCLAHFQRVNKDQTACEKSIKKSAKNKRTETECEKRAIKERGVAAKQIDLVARRNRTKRKCL